MATGYLLNGACFPSLQRAADAFGARYPLQDAGSLYELTSAITINSTTGTLTVPYRVGKIDGNNTWSSQTEVLTLTPPACDTADMQVGPEFAFTLVAASCLMFGLGFIGTR